MAALGAPEEANLGQNSSQEGISSLPGRSRSGSNFNRASSTPRPLISDQGSGNSRQDSQPNSRDKNRKHRAQRGDSHDGFRKPHREKQWRAVEKTESGTQAAEVPRLSGTESPGMQSTNQILTTHATQPASKESSKGLLSGPPAKPSGSVTVAARSAGPVSSSSQDWRVGSDSSGPPSSQSDSAVLLALGRPGQGNPKNSQYCLQTQKASQLSAGAQIWQPAPQAHGHPSLPAAKPGQTAGAEVPLPAEASPAGAVPFALPDGLRTPAEGIGSGSRGRGRTGVGRGGQGRGDSSYAQPRRGDAGGRGLGPRSDSTARGGRGRGRQHSGGSLMDGQHLGTQSTGLGQQTVQRMPHQNGRPERGRGEGGGRGRREEMRERGRGRTGGGRGGGPALASRTDGEHLMGSTRGREGRFGAANAGKVLVSTEAGGLRQREVSSAKELAHQKEEREEEGKEAVPALVRSIERKLARGEVECMICCDRVGRSAACWSCRSCYAIFHLHCIRSWARAPTSAVPSSSSTSFSDSSVAAATVAIGGPAATAAGGGDVVGSDGLTAWRCPGCQAPQLFSAPGSLRYTCFCGQRENPPLDHYLTPHSCGDTCSRPLGQTGDASCPHACSLQCHPGPCPPCSSMVTVACYCGREKVSRRCRGGGGSGPTGSGSDAPTNSSGGLSCGRTCGRPMGCGRHACERPCHDGPCGVCKEVVLGRCFCGKKTEALQCKDVGHLLRSTVAAEKQDGEERGESRGVGDAVDIGGTGHSKQREEKEGQEEEREGEPGQIHEGACETAIALEKDGLPELFSCEAACGAVLACGYHSCERLCHAGPCGDCQLAPSTTCTCPCGKQLLSSLSSSSSSPRISCLDPRPSCGAQCGHVLPCGLHTCKLECHEGRCAFNRCMEEVEQRCLCGGKSRRVECWQARQSGEPFVCERKCGSLKSCGRHRCTARCCPKSPATAAGRAAAAAAGRTLAGGSSPSTDAAAQDSAADPHLCLLPCAKPLKCGIHTCQQLCHPSHCLPCLSASFLELSCACGAESIPPPIPCGTPPPPCSRPCSLPQPCGHPPSHTCHPSGPCPPCPLPVPKKCAGGHIVLSSVPCGAFASPSPSAASASDSSSAPASTSSASSSSLWQSNYPPPPTCSSKCGQVRQCGKHTCLRVCHVGPCDSLTQAEKLQGPLKVQQLTGEQGHGGGQGGTKLEASKPRSCGQPCGAPLGSCPHTCPAPCHPFSPCPTMQCREMVSVSCSCGRRSERVPCAGARAQAAGATARTPATAVVLPCDADCEREKKREALTEAFDPWRGQDGSVWAFSPAALAAAKERGGGWAAGSAAATATAQQEQEEQQQLLQVARSQGIPWLVAVEARMRAMLRSSPSKQLPPPAEGGVGGASAPSVGWAPGAPRVHVFCPMEREKRELLHFMAGRWGLEHCSIGREPRRSTVVYLLPGKPGHFKSNGGSSWRPGQPLGKAVKPASDAPHSAAAPVGKSPSVLQGACNPPPFDPALDMDPGCLVSLFDLPPDANVSRQLLPFGGECSLGWLDDGRNAVLLFDDPRRVATAVRIIQGASPLRAGAVCGSPSQRSRTVNSANVGWGSAVEERGAAAAAWEEEDEAATVSDINTAVHVGTRGGGVDTAPNRWQALAACESGAADAWDEEGE